MIILPVILPAQYNISFHHITTLNGLSDNNVVNATLDRNGYLWICTTEGLNRYDGRVMTNYYSEDYPQLRNNNIREVLCDTKNRLWIRTFGGYISMLDENRRWREIRVRDNEYPVRIFNFLETKSRGMVLFHGKQQFVSGTSDTAFKRWRFSDDSVFDQRLFYYSKLSPDEVVWTGSDEFFIMNYASARVSFRKKIPRITSAEAFDKNTLYITTSESGGLYRFNLETRELTPLTGLKDQYGNNIFSSLQMVRKMADNRLIITSAFAGLYVYDPSLNKLYRFVHDPLKTRSVSGNNYYNLVTDTSGYVLIASPTSGMSYFNIRNKPATWIGAVRDEKGNIFDGYVNAILSAGEPGVFWLGCFNQLIRWDKKRGIGEFFEYGIGRDEAPNRGNDEITAMCKDGKGRLWVGTANNGITILDSTGKLLYQLNDYNSLLPSNNINYLLHDSGKIWITTSGGICRGDVLRTRIDPIPKTSTLSALATYDCGTTWIDSKNRLWIGSSRDGAYRYDPASNTIRNFIKPNDSTSLEVFAFQEDAAGQIYLGTRTGLVVLSHDSVVANYTRSDGLRGDRCENILKDGNGNLWIDNHNSIIRYNPINRSFNAFDEKAGLSAVGFRPRSGYRDENGYLYFGSEKGFSFFHPDSITEPEAILKVFVSSLEGKDGELPVNNSRKIELDYDNNSVVFHIAAIDLDQARNIYYRYRLKGFDKEWITEPNISNVRYNALDPGKYTFEVQASVNGVVWRDALYNANLEIIPALWQTEWFRFIASFLLAVLFYLAIKQREKNANSKARERAKMEEMRSQALQYQLEIEQVINYFSNSLSGLNTVDDILWDVVKTCISQLGFQDCVIYLFNPEKTLLVQKAAFGPKNLDYVDIYNRIEIPPGSGVVGHVAVTGIAEIIADTSKDPRYLPDDAVRLSEIAIPLISNDEVVGVIDSEHPDANFYNNRHLQILTAIASMVVNKTEQLQAEADSRRKEIEMARLQRDVATLQLTATRAQMNPHFIFNALNSVQQYILRGNTDEANKYLSRFSRLQREILNHCDRPFISLQKEIDMLRMYLQLEQLRFNGSFDFELCSNGTTDLDEIKIPPMILQPFVENAIWHGLMPKVGHRKVSVEFNLDEHSEMLHCIIFDNGIGRQAAAHNKQRDVPETDHVSKGLSLVYSRLQLLHEQFGQSFTSKIEDLEDEFGNSAGTRVEVIMFTGF